MALRVRGSTTARQFCWSARGGSTGLVALERSRRSRIRPRLGAVRSHVEAVDIQGAFVASVDSFKGIQLTEDSETPVLIAEERISQGDTLLSVAQDKWISLKTVSASPIGSAVAKLEAWLQLALFLIAEKANPASPWQPFLTSLPQSLNSPAFWPESDLAMIEGSQLHESALGYRQFFRQKYKELESELFKEHPVLFDRQVFDEAAFSWAVGSVRSQIHSPMDGDQIALVPAIAHIRHGRDANVELKCSTGNVFNREAALSVQALREISPGEQLLMDFSPEKSDSQIALDYGDFDAANPQGGYQLSMQLPDSDLNYDDKLDVLDVCGIKEPLSFEFLPETDPPDGILPFLRLLNLSGPDSFLLEAIFRSEMDEHLAYPVSPENEANACATMISGCQAALEPYKALQDATMEDPKLSLMQQVCYGEQKTLEWIQTWFEKRKESLKDLEYYAERRLKRLGLLDDDGQSTFEDMWKGGIA